MFIKIANGVHRGQTVTGIFPVVKPYNGKFVTIKTDARTPFMVVNARVSFVKDDDFEYCSAEGEKIDPASIVADVSIDDIEQEEFTMAEQEFFASETELDAMNRIQKTFSMLNEVTAASAKGIIRGLIVSGPPGIGKSFGVEETLREANVMTVLKGNDPDYEIVKGSASPLGVYKTLYAAREKRKVVVFDDCDSILFDDVSLNLLKAALDSGHTRVLSWRSESRALAEADIPNNFEFEGSVIFLTNIDFERTRASRIKQHLDALQSRCHYMNLDISNQRDQLIRIKQIVRDGMLKSYDFQNNEEQVIVQYVIDNADHMRELSLRMVKKIADFVKMKPFQWEDFVEATCLKRESKFKRLLNKKNS